MADLSITAANVVKGANARTAAILQLAIHATGVPN